MLKEGMTDLLKNYVKETTKNIVDKPEDVVVNVSVSTKAIIIQIEVDNRDCGKIIGKRGRTIDSLKVICLAIKNTNFPEDSRRVMLEVLEDAVALGRGHLAVHHTHSPLLGKFFLQHLQRASQRHKQNDFLSCFFDHLLDQDIDTIVLS